MKKLYLVIFMLACAALGSGGVLAGRLSDVRGTVHNLSSDVSPTRAVKSQESGICIFCHTAHGSPVLAPPLWNKTLSAAIYTTYKSSSLDALTEMGITDLPQPGDSSKLCLSCHDGTVAVGTVSWFKGLSNQTIDLYGVDTGGIMPAGSGATTGYTRRLGTDLSNDHPISVGYTSTLATRDGELQAVDSDQKWISPNGLIIGPRGDPRSPKLPLFGSVPSAQVQCPTCHDPHIRDDNTAVVGNQKFLRLNRFQEAQPGAGFSEANGDIICLGCHKAGNSWAYSAHANWQVATQAYNAVPGDLREFPTGLQVRKASCLNCHDTHTVQGARRLLREGTDSTAIPKTGGNPASEETCFQCHIAGGSSILTSVLTVPDIKSDYDLPIRMPLRSSDQGAGSEVHDIGGNFDDSYLPESGVNCNVAGNKCGADFVEQRQKLGTSGSFSNRHAECSDCHNPHRVVKFRDFRGDGLGNLTGTPDLAGTHKHTAGHTNIASGVLRGMTGVEPDYAGQSSFQTMPTSFFVKRGDPLNLSGEAATESYVTREYQVCFKCHSNYGYADNNQWLGNRPNLGSSGGGTPSGTNGLTQFTNQAKEFQAPTTPTTHKGEVTTTDSGAHASYSTNNHRSWHPVMDNTGRTAAAQGTFLLPWNGATDIGAQTMYCSDCHGSATVPSTGSTGTVVPTGGEDGSAWGPHGSSNNFLLKGAWNQSVGGASADALCFRCHVYDQYANPAAVKLKSGFSTATDINLHVQIPNRMVALGQSLAGWRCTKCHEAVSHGWKNKALLVNLNDIGPETGNPAGTTYAPVAGTSGYSQQPYYLGAWLSVTSFAASGTWTSANCGGSAVGNATSIACGAAP